MVKIRYAELPAGLHVATEAGDRCTIVYLKPGLTREQRKDALIVARRSARFGHGPSLPPLDMAFALAADRSRTTARITVAAMRKHPLMLLPLLALVVGIIATGILASGAIVTITPRVSSAQSSDLVQFSVGQLVTSGPGTRPGPQNPAPGSGTTPAAGSGPVQSASVGGASHGRGHDRGHLAGNLQRPVPGWARRGGKGFGAIH